MYSLLYLDSFANSEIIDIIVVFYSMLSRYYYSCIEIKINVKQYLNVNKGNTIDAIGEMYTEFLRYANNDSNLGIVLTPPHVTDLMCELVDLKVTKDHIDTVIDKLVVELLDF